MDHNRLALASLALAVALGLTAKAEETGDPDKGQKIFNRCKACHVVEQGGKSRTGPNLHGVIGRQAGSVEDYKYSDAMKKAGQNGLTWTPEKLHTYLADPRGMMPGNKMAFPGLKDAKERSDVIAYIARQSK